MTTRVLRLLARSSYEVVSICGDVEKYGGKVLGITPNMDRNEDRPSFEINIDGAPLYFVFASCPEPVDGQVRVWER
jgi:hypothetical protein